MAEDGYLGSLFGDASDDMDITTPARVEMDTDMVVLHNRQLKGKARDDQKIHQLIKEAQSIDCKQDDRDVVLQKHFDQLTETEKRQAEHDSRFSLAMFPPLPEAMQLDQNTTHNSAALLEKQQRMVNMGANISNGKSCPQKELEEAPMPTTNV
ncbi:hypothetical protein MMC25_000705 [Agyrium rufum]|nr:hypothetical protein [Agyrium rufum]